MGAQLIIGLTGRKRAGKGTAYKILEELCGKDNFTISRVSSSLILAEALNAFALPTTRENLQLLPVVMNEAYGANSLANAVKSRIEKSETDIICYDGVRLPADIEMIKTFPKSLLIFIDASLETRYGHATQTAEKIGESSSTFEEFQATENAPVERYLGDIKNFSSVINNDGTPEELKKRLESLFTQNILPLLQA